MIGLDTDGDMLLHEMVKTAGYTENSERSNALPHLQLTREERELLNLGLMPRLVRRPETQDTDRNRTEGSISTNTKGKQAEKSTSTNIQRKQADKSTKTKRKQGDKHS
ncbi:hypothetical protein Pmar_PMAR000355 [Perkinsus marinus ATCC 50983]|uniref:Uncharacterized protein n=1 Tax=Perkinsus marinus (strain ATCC 50983 / TXsc) TaxID=423536 RepID=C5KQ10_PERM5|nr:hypothetical protein Pmar_PMAR000355 [Perkinsus marinus ATCC 50983]EER13433.1 hypothetical protein Pmar_PMAR000355 [Perkinsus marinus ATCC 50983]|eukprot:XP_002781638.1 hypothetical protein Pmar_PMAR000355 [Perkinsus marinus ATCC 50983]